MKNRYYKWITAQGSFNSFRTSLEAHTYYNSILNCTVFRKQQQENEPTHAILSPNCRRKMRRVAFNWKVCLISEYECNILNNDSLHITNCRNIEFSNTNTISHTTFEFIGSDTFS